MSAGMQTSLEKLHIWQQNIRKSDIAQAAMLNSASPIKWDVLAIQEPFFDRLGNTKASRYWRVIYPTDHRKDGSTRSRSVLLINTNIPTDAYTILKIHSTDIAAVRFRGDHRGIFVYGIYNACKHNNTLAALSHFLSSPPCTSQPSPADHMLWLGDFNWHHPLWESVANRHLNSTEALIQLPLDLIEDHNMELTLLPYIPTLETAAGNWTRPDNVWCSHASISSIVSCDVSAAIHPPITDHLPIVTTVEFPIPRSPPRPLKNFREVDWTAFGEALKERLITRLPAQPITSAEEFHATVTDLTLIIQEVIGNEDIVPTSKPCPYTKRWWNKDLGRLKAQRC